jgi:hypothetical protein
MDNVTAAVCQQAREAIASHHRAVAAMALSAICQAVTPLPPALPLPAPPAVARRHKPALPSDAGIAEVQWSVVRFTCPVCKTDLTLTNNEAQRCTCGQIYRASPMVEAVNPEAYG